MNNKKMRILLGFVFCGMMGSLIARVSVDHIISSLEEGQFEDIEDQLTGATPLQLYALSGFIGKKIESDFFASKKQNKISGLIADLPLDQVFLLTQPAFLLAGLVGGSVLVPGDVAKNVGMYAGATTLPAIPLAAHIILKKAAHWGLRSNTLSQLDRLLLFVDHRLAALGGENKDVLLSVVPEKTIPVSSEEIAFAIISGDNTSAVSKLVSSADYYQRMLAEGVIDKMIRQELYRVGLDKKVISFFAEKSAIPAGGAYVASVALLTGLLDWSSRGSEFNKLSAGIFLGILTIPGIAAYLAYKLPKMIAERQLTNDTIKQLQALKKELTEHHTLTKEETHEK